MRSFLYAGALLLTAVSAQAAQAYKLTDLGAFTSAFGVNNAGQVVGADEGVALMGVLWDGATGARLADGSIHASWQGAVFQGVTETGQIFGDAYRQAAIWNGGVMTVLDPSGEVRGLSGTGLAVGNVRADGGPPAAMLWEGATPVSLGAERSSANSVNDAGQVVGYRFTNLGVLEAMLWQGGQTTTLATLGGDAAAADINEAGKVVGASALQSGSTERHAVLWDETGVHDLGSLGGTSNANGINARGEIVGESLEGAVSRATLWRNGEIIDLSSLGEASGLRLAFAGGINDNGWIVGTAFDVKGIRHGFVLTPVPEPQTYVMAFAGMAVTGLALRRRRRSAVA